MLVHFNGVPHMISPKPPRRGVVNLAPHTHRCMDCGATVACHGCDDALEMTMCAACLTRLAAEMQREAEAPPQPTPARDW